ncbi:DUF2924 domain-containing protein [Ancylobacter polymorphus]|uniref:DUF2924 domain-containing protein n=1 Tax=Ancylobacter polymorphus TaxID=223390 RepID=A0A9E7A362_9HYPH|nr:DUF2924 domain-containing protein [Ancylobacter polymorphus]UOK71863.1 DUF2924 domain-containing protein [Ancylobacter polymorphus]
MAKHDLAPRDIDRELARLGELSLDELKTRFRDLTGSALPKYMRRGLIELAVGHALQAKLLGGLDRETRKKLEDAVATIVPKGEPPPKPKRQNRKLKPGTRLIRQWHGRLYEVTVTRNGFDWDGKSFGSLTEIAQTITGTKWNGWVFFGIKKPAPANMKANRAGHPKNGRGTPLCPTLDSVPPESSSSAPESVHG